MRKPERMRWYKEKLKHLIRDPALTVEAKFLWVLMDSFASSEGIECRPTVITLMRHSGRSKKWVEKYLRELKEQERIKIIGRALTPNGKYVNQYRIRYDQIGTPKRLPRDGSKKDPLGRVEKGPTTKYHIPQSPENVVPFDGTKLEEDSAAYGTGL